MLYVSALFSILWFGQILPSLFCSLSLESCQQHKANPATHLPKSTNGSLLPSGQSPNSLTGFARASQVWASLTLIGRGERAFQSARTSWECRNEAGGGQWHSEWWLRRSRGSAAGLQKFISALCHLLAMWPWASFWSSLDLSFPICQILKACTYFMRLWRGLNELI